MLGYSTVDQCSLDNSQLAHPDRAMQDRRLHVLIVDDDPTNRRVLQGMLELLGYACTVVDDGAKAVQAVEEGQFDVVLMDCLMPVMDGYDATRAIRSDEAARVASHAGRLPVIAVTALAMQGARDRCLEAGMDDYLTKPVMLENLKDVLGRWVGQQQQQHQHAVNAWNTAPTVPAQAADSPIDETMLDELRALGDDAGAALITELVHDFGVEIPSRFPLMRAAVSNNDIPALLHELHFVAGCAGIVGARHVERIARSVDAKNAPASAEAAAELVSRLEAAFATAHGLLAAIATTSQR
jgi:CheY-like chemotaxis protein/HPt (histidine-containing phosphotransfer) domain-containing protein